MDEKLQGLLLAAQRAATEVGAAACSLADSAGEKADAMVTAGKLKVRLADLKAQDAVLLQEVGAMVYATHTGDPTDSSTLLAKLQEIDEVRSRTERISAQLRQVRGVEGACPFCGATVKKGDCFCRECGVRL